MKYDIIIREYSSSDYQDVANAAHPFNIVDLKLQYGLKGWILKVIDFFCATGQKRVRSIFKGRPKSHWNSDPNKDSRAQEE